MMPTVRPSASSQMVRIICPLILIDSLSHACCKLKAVVSAGRGGASSHKCLDTGLGTTQDQGVDVMRPLIGVDGLQIHENAHDVKFLSNAVGAMHVAGGTGNLERLATIVALEQRDRRGRS